MSFLSRCQNNKKLTWCIWLFVGIFLIGIFGYALEVGDDSECFNGQGIVTEDNIWKCIQLDDVFTWYNITIIDNITYYNNTIINATTGYFENIVVENDGTVGNDWNVSGNINSKNLYMNPILIGDSQNTANLFGITLGFNSHASTGVAIGDDMNVENGIGIGDSIFALSSAIAIGDGVNAYGAGDIVLGLNSEADVMTTDSIVIGRLAKSESHRSITMGLESFTSGNNAIAMGIFSSSEDLDTIAIGRESNASGESAISIGKESVSSGKNALAIGVDAHAPYENSVAIGTGVWTTQPNTVKIGNQSIIFDYNEGNGSFSGDITSAGQICDINGCIAVDSLALDQSNWENDSNKWIYWTNTDSRINFNESKLTTTYYDAVNYSVITGIGEGNISHLREYDGIALNITEDASDFELRVNFSIGTGNTFNQLIIRYKAEEEDATHLPLVQIYKVTEDEWENYGSLPSFDTYHLVEFGVFDSDEHIDVNGIVQVRIYQDEGSPPKTHLHNIDWVTISKGFGTPSGEEVDPHSFYLDGSKIMEGNANWNNHNISGVDIFEVNGTYNNDKVGFSMQLLNAQDHYREGIHIDLEYSGSDNSMTLGNFLGEHKGTSTDPNIYGIQMQSRINGAGKSTTDAWSAFYDFGSTASQTSGTHTARGIVTEFGGSNYDGTASVNSAHWWIRDSSDLCSSSNAKSWSMYNNERDTVCGDYVDMFVGANNVKICQGANDCDSHSMYYDSTHYILGYDESNDIIMFNVNATNGLSIDGTDFKKNNDTITTAIAGAGGSGSTFNASYDAHIKNNSQAHSDYLINNGNDITTGVLTTGGLTMSNLDIITLGSYGKMSTDALGNFIIENPNIDDDLNIYLNDGGVRTLFLTFDGSISQIDLGVALDVSSENILNVNQLIFDADNWISTDGDGIHIGSDGGDVNFCDDNVGSVASCSEIDVNVPDGFLCVADEGGIASCGTVDGTVYADDFVEYTSFYDTNVFGSALESKKDIVGSYNISSGKSTLDYSTVSDFTKRTSYKFPKYLNISEDYFDYNSEEEYYNNLAQKDKDNVVIIHGRSTGALGTENEQAIIELLSRIEYLEENCVLK